MHSEVKERFTCLDQFNQGQGSAPYSRSHHLYLAKYTLLAKAVLLVCYHHGLSRDELAGLRLSSLTVADEVATLTMPTGATRPLFDLETAFHQTLEDWYRLRRYEEPQEYLFGAILKDGRFALPHNGGLCRADALCVFGRCGMSYGHARADFVRFDGGS